MRIGVVKTSFKENEKRVPIYPEHLPWIPPDIRKQLIFETGYGRDYGFNDDYFSLHRSKLAYREELFNTCDLLILPKAVQFDLEQMNEHQILWGWAHCVQQHSITQLAIERKLTLIAWEAMHHWGAADEKLMHIFYKNNEIAGYAAAIHVLQLLGMDGHYGPRRKVVIMGYGSVSRGVIYALQGRGFNNIHVYTIRPTHLVADQNPDVYYKNIIMDENGQILARNYDGIVHPFIKDLSEADIICNCVLQDTDNPMVFVYNDQLSELKPHSIIIDISCDEGMGFSFAKPTTFEEPIFTVGDNITYYSVDHTPTYLWNAASREISRQLIPFLSEIAAGSLAWEKNESIRRAIEIKDGIVNNQKILSFQKRDSQYPYQYI